MAIRRYGFGIVVGVWTEINGLVVEVRIAKEVDDRDVHLSSVKLGQKVLIDVTSSNAGVAEEAAVSLSKKLAIHVNGKAFSRAIASRSTKD